METPSNEGTPLEPIAEEPTFHFSGSMTLDDFYAGVKLIRRMRGKRVWLWLWAAFTVVFLLVIGAIAVSARPYSVSSSNVIGLVTIAFPVLFAVRILADRIKIKRMFLNRTGPFEDVVSTIGPTGRRSDSGASPHRTPEASSS